MSNILAHYSPEDVYISYAGIPLNGLWEGDFVTIRKEGGNFSSRSSSDGMSVRTSNDSGLYEVRIYLHSGSDSNNTLSRLASLDYITKMGKLPLTLKDQLGSTLFFSASAWVESAPIVSLGITITEREWIFKCSDCTMVVGGNENPSGVTEDTLGGLLGSSFLGNLLGG